MRGTGDAHWTKDTNEEAIILKLVNNTKYGRSKFIKVSNPRIPNESLLEVVVNM